MTGRSPGHIQQHIHMTMAMQARTGLVQLVRIDVLNPIRGEGRASNVFLAVEAAGARMAEKSSFPDLGNIGLSTFLMSEAKRQATLI